MDRDDVRTKYGETFTRKEFLDIQESSKFLENIMKKDTPSIKKKETTWNIKVKKKSVVDTEKDAAYKNEIMKLKISDNKLALSGKNPRIWRWAFNPVN